MSKQVKLSLLLILLIPCWVIGYHGVGDIGMYYAVARYAENFEFSKIYGVNAGVGHFFYGPLSLIFFGWMPQFSYEKVRGIWIFFNTCAYVIFWWALHKVYPFLKKQETSILWFVVWIASIKGIHASFQSHNVQLMIVAVLLCGEYFRIHSNRWVRFFSGWGTVFAGEIKVFPLFVSVFTFLRSEKWVCYGILLASVLGGILPLVYFGPENALNLYKVFIFNLGNFHDYAPLTKDAVTLSLASLIATWFSPLVGMEYSVGLNKFLIVLVGGAFILSSYLKRHTLPMRFQTHVFSLGLAIMALINSTTRPDYFVFFVPAFASLVELWQERKLSIGFVGGILVSLFLINFISEWTLGSRELGHKLELYRLPVVGMVVLCGTLYLAVQSQIRRV